MDSEGFQVPGLAMDKVDLVGAEWIAISVMDTSVHSAELASSFIRGMASGFDVGVDDRGNIVSLG
jgi:hypothetical protein